MAECKPLLTPKVDVKWSQELEEESHKVNADSLEKRTVWDNGWIKDDAVLQKHCYGNGAECRHSSGEDKDPSYTAVERSVLEDVV